MNCIYNSFSLSRIKAGSHSFTEIKTGVFVYFFKATFVNFFYYSSTHINSKTSFQGVLLCNGIIKCGD